MKEEQTKQRTSVAVHGNVVLLLLGLVIALGLAKLLLRAFPNVVPAEIRVNPPMRRVKALIDETYDLKKSDGDLYHYVQGRITPLSPELDDVEAHAHMTETIHDDIQEILPPTAGEIPGH